EPVRRGPESQGGRYRRTAAVLVLAHQVSPRTGLHPDRAAPVGLLPAAVLVCGDQRRLLQSLRRVATDLSARHPAPAWVDLHPAAAAVLRQLRHLLRTVPVL